MKTMRARHLSQPKLRSAGMSLIELMVGVAIAMLATLVIINAFSMSESSKRNITGAGDAAQTGNLLARYLQRTIEEAGSAMTAPHLGLLGCRLNIKASGVVQFPATAALAAPFGSVPQNLRSAPFIAVSGSNNRDTLIVMAGRPTASTQDYGAAYSTTLSFTNTPALGFAANDYLLGYELNTGTNTLDCYTMRVASSFAPSASNSAPAATLGSNAQGKGKDAVPIDGNFNTPPSSWQTFLLRNLGQEPSLIALAIGSDDALYRINLLNPAAGAQIIAENVVALQARYGVDTNNDDVVDSWVDPTGTWAVGNLLNGTEANAALLKQILAARISFVTRSSQLATAEAANATVTLFPDQSPPVSMTMPTTNGRYQYQVYDLTVPLPNVRALQ